MQRIALRLERRRRLRIAIVVRPIHVRVADAVHVQALLRAVLQLPPAPRLHLVHARGAHQQAPGRRVRSVTAGARAVRIRPDELLVADLQVDDLHRLLEVLLADWEPRAQGEDNYKY